MRFNIRCDMEGLTGVTSYQQVVPGESGYEEGRDLLMHDLGAVVEGIVAADSEAEIVVFDEHYEGRNIRVLDLPHRVRCVLGKPPYTIDDPGLISGCAGMLLVGFHAKAGTVGGTLPHTYEHDILDIQINGASIGEIGIEAAIAGEAGVPTLFYCGDSAGSHELAEISPGTVRVSVKESITDTAAVCLGGPLTRETLRSAAKQAVENREGVPPVDLGRPVQFRVRLKQGRFSEVMRSLYPAMYDGQEWLQSDAPTVTAAFVNYTHQKLSVLRLMSLD